METMTAYDEGWHDALYGIGVYQNPYNMFTQEHKDFERGWNECQDE